MLIRSILKRLKMSCNDIYTELYWYIYYRITDSCDAVNYERGILVRDHECFQFPERVMLVFDSYKLLCH